MEDKETLALFASGNTKGIFQFEQPGAIRLLKRVQPVCFEDVVATTSLNRPGASDYINNFVARKHGQEEVTVLDSALEDILAPTYGIMLYQEQVMQVAQRFAGFSLGKADILRRAMGKKDASAMHEMRASFIHGSIEAGHTAEKAEQVLMLWRSLQVMVLTGHTPMPTQPWPSNWLISKHIIQLFFIRSC